MTSAWKWQHNQVSQLAERGSHFSNEVNPLRSRRGERQLASIQLFP